MESGGRVAGGRDHERGVRGIASGARRQSEGGEFGGREAAGAGRRADPAMGRCPPHRDRAMARPAFRAGRRGGRRDLVGDRRGLEAGPTRAARGIVAGSTAGRGAGRHGGGEPGGAGRAAAGLGGRAVPDCASHGPCAARPRATTRLTIELILAWADAHHSATGQWPRIDSGPVRDHPELNWGQVNRALSAGLPRPAGRGHAGRSAPGAPGRPQQAEPAAPGRRADPGVGRRPSGGHGRVPSRSTPARCAACPGETWATIHSALSKGVRGLPGGSSLARAPGGAPRLPRPADRRAHPGLGRCPSRGHRPMADLVVVRRRSGASPARRGRASTSRCGRAAAACPGGTTLAQLLAEHRQAPNIYTEPPLTAEQILAWADAHRAATGRWPSSALRPGAPRRGRELGLDRHGPARGLSRPAGRPVARPPDPRARRPGRVSDPPRADASSRSSPGPTPTARPAGEWPVEDSGPVHSAPGENWKAISGALARGDRGLPGGSSLARLLAEHRGARNPKDLPRLQIEQILAWADAHRAATGRWPSSASGPVAEGSEETWAVVNMALYKGLRGLPGGSSLARLLAKHRPVRPRRLSLRKIRTWARAHREATGRWPDAHAGPVRGVPDEIWSAIDAALKFGRRGLPGGSSLTALFDRSLDPAAHGIRPELTVEQVLSWADAHRAATGRWPTLHVGPGRRRARREMGQPRRGVAARPPRPPERHEPHPPHRRASRHRRPSGGRDAIAGRPGRPGRRRRGESGVGRRRDVYRGIPRRQLQARLGSVKALPRRLGRSDRLSKTGGFDSESVPKGAPRHP